MKETKEGGTEMRDGLQALQQALAKAVGLPL